MRSEAFHRLLKIIRVIFRQKITDLTAIFLSLMTIVLLAILPLKIHSTCTVMKILLELETQAAEHRSQIGNLYRCLPDNFLPQENNKCLCVLLLHEKKTANRYL